MLRILKPDILNQEMKLKEKQKQAMEIIKGNLFFIKFYWTSIKTDFIKWKTELLNL